MVFEKLNLAAMVQAPGDVIKDHDQFCSASCCMRHIEIAHNASTVQESRMIVALPWSRAHTHTHKREKTVLLLIPSHPCAVFLDAWLHMLIHHVLISITATTIACVCCVTAKQGGHVGGGVACSRLFIP